MQLNCVAVLLILVYAFCHCLLHFEQINMYMCMRVCMCVYMRVCMHVCCHHYNRPIRFMTKKAEFVFCYNVATTIDFQPLNACIICLLYTSDAADE